jgi:hypothetical protein
MAEREGSSTQRPPDPASLCAVQRLRPPPLPERRHKRSGDNPGEPRVHLHVCKVCQSAYSSKLIYDFVDKKNGPACGRGERDAGIPEAPLLHYVSTADDAPREPSDRGCSYASTTTTRGMSSCWAKSRVEGIRYSVGNCKRGSAISA